MTSKTSKTSKFKRWIKPKWEKDTKESLVEKVPLGKKQHDLVSHQ